MCSRCLYPPLFMLQVLIPPPLFVLKVADVYRALGGELGDAADAGDAAASLLGEKKAVTKEEFAAALKEQYDLDIDVDELFAKHVGMELKMADLEELIFRDPPTG